MTQMIKSPGRQKHKSQTNDWSGTSTPSISGKQVFIEARRATDEYRSNSTIERQILKSVQGWENSGDLKWHSEIPQELPPTIQEHVSTNPASCLNIVLEVFEGYVKRVEDGIAYVKFNTIGSSSPEEFVGSYPFDKLCAKGIKERNRFRLETVFDGNTVKVNFEPLPDGQFTDEEMSCLDKRLSNLIEDDTLNGDY